MHQNATARAGFTFVEVIVTLVVLLILTAVITPTIISELDRMRIEGTRTDLETFVAGITAFQDDVGDYPLQLSYLSSELVNGDDNSCGANFSNGERNNWDGPYVQRVLPTTGTPLQIGNARNVLTRLGGSGNALLFVTIDSVTEEDAVALNRMVDNDNNSLSGSVWWIPLDPSSALVTLGYAMPVNGC